MMGGDTGVESQPGVGSRFWLTARLRLGSGLSKPVPTEAGTPPPTPTPAPDRSVANAHVLLVEDNPINREVASELLHAIGLQVDVAENGRQALECHARTRYDLILMDMQMPVLDGVEATRAIRARPDGGSIPIIAMTANAFDDDRQRCFAAGMNDFIAKPVDPAQLQDTLLKWLPPKVQDTHPEPSVQPLPPLATEAALRQRLAAIHGLDVEYGMAMTLNRFVFYLRILRMFCDKNGDVPHQLRKAIAKGDAAQLQELAHALKASAGNIGATELSRGAATLMQAARQGSGGPDGHTLHLADDLEILIRKLEAALTL
jgi:two-component system sensor histidine kinase/response regulator